MTASTKPHFVNFKGASKPCTKQRFQCPPRYVCRVLFLGRPGLAVASAKRINICPLGLILRIALRAENPRRQEEGNWLGVAKQMCKIPSHSKKICKGKRSSCGLKSQRCHVTHFLEPPDATLRRSNALSSKQTRVPDMTSTIPRIPHPARLNPIIADHS
jgi:hypothetical protein